MSDDEYINAGRMDDLNEEIIYSLGYKDYDNRYVSFGFMLENDISPFKWTHLALDDLSERLTAIEKEVDDES